MKKMNDSIREQALKMHEAWTRDGQKDSTWLLSEIASVIGISKLSLSKIWKNKK